MKVLSNLFLKVGQSWYKLPTPIKAIIFETVSTVINLMQLSLVTATIDFNWLFSFLPLWMSQRANWLLLPYWLLVRAGTISILDYCKGRFKKLAEEAKATVPATEVDPTKVEKLDKKVDSQISK